MTAIVEALDTFPPVQAGENGHAELAWSNSIQERIVQFDFQCVRTDASKIAELATVLHDLLRELSVSFTDEEKEAQRRLSLTLLYKIVGKTRDIEGGKGEYALSYMMIWEWSKFYPYLASVAISLFVMSPTMFRDFIPVNPYGKEEEVPDQIPYGSWKDIKYFALYVREHYGSINHPLIKYCAELINYQISLDWVTYNSTEAEDKKTISLAAKWVPRESSKKFGWLYEYLACEFYPEFMASVKNGDHRKAIKKCKAQYRVLCSTLNRHLDTVQIKQSGRQWADIDHSKTTSITMMKQRSAFMNLTKAKEQRSEEEDRILCAQHLTEYLDTLKNEGKEVKGKNVSLHDFAKEILATGLHDVEASDIINSQWRDNANKKNANGLGPMIAMVDTSGSMSGDPLCAAIALGCRIAEKSTLGKRVMTFSAEPAWINLDGCDTFSEMVRTIMAQSRTAGLNTDFYKALDLILTVIEEKRVPAEEVENMILTILSDMQIDDNLTSSYGDYGYGYHSADPKLVEECRAKWLTMYENIKQKYSDVGIRMYGAPLHPPHILFWNLRSTSGFPTLSSQVNCSMMSGFDPMVLNLFCELGISALRDLTPYTMLQKQLSNERYRPLELVVEQRFRTFHME
jgi:hypothetical protein